VRRGYFAEFRPKEAYPVMATANDSTDTHTPSVQPCGNATTKIGFRVPSIHSVNSPPIRTTAKGKRKHGAAVSAVRVDQLSRGRSSFHMSLCAKRILGLPAVLMIEKVMVGIAKSIWLGSRRHVIAREVLEAEG
jgi:hypothetical protein